MRKKFRIKNLDCASCAAALENQIRKIDGVVDAAITFATSSFVLETNDDIFNDVFAKVIKLTHEMEPDVIIEEMGTKAKEKFFSPRKIVAYSTLIAGATIGIVACKVESLPGFAFWPMLIVGALLIGWETYYKALRLLIKGTINENLLVTISAAGAIAIGEHFDGLMVVILYTIGKILESLAVEKSKSSIEALTELQPEYANVINGNITHRVDPSDVKVGDHIIVKMGERVPLDGICLTDGGFIDCRHLTGESAPVKIEKGEEIRSGSIVLDGIFEIKVTKKYSDSTVSQIMNLLENASEKKSKTESFISNFAKWYTLIVVALSFVTFGIVYAILKDSSVAIYRGLTFLVISCPCAFAISVPLSYFSGIGNASKKGILVKGSNYLDVCANLSTVVFDKTGTLTSGHFDIKKIEVIDKTKTENDILVLAASGEQNSIHPIARAIVHGAKGNKLVKVKNFAETVGVGVSYTIGKNNYKITGDSTNTGATVQILENEKVIGKITLIDEIKPESYLAINALNHKKITSIMLSGDGKKVSESVAKELGLSEYHAKMEPKDKFSFLENLILTKKKGQNIAFVGDGINDAPALRLADCGISMGLEGSPATVEASDVVLVDDNPAKLKELIDLSKNTRKIVIENIAFACIIKVLFLVLSSIGISNMFFAVFADVGVTVLCTLNSLRALFYHLPHNKCDCHEHKHHHKHHHEHEQHNHKHAH